MSYNFSNGRADRVVAGPNGAQFVGEFGFSAPVSNDILTQAITQARADAAQRQSHVQNQSKFDKNYYMTANFSVSPQEKALIDAGKLRYEDVWTPAKREAMYQGIAASMPTQQAQAQATSPLLQGDISDPVAYINSLPSELNYLVANQLPTLGGFRQSYDRATGDTLREAQRGGASHFGRFAKGAAPLALTAAALVAGPALLGSLGAGTAGASGVAAGGATASGLGSLGSTIAGAFNTTQALSGAIAGGLGGLASGGDLSSALKGAAFGGIGGGFGSSLGSSIGLTSVPAQTAFRGALTGAAGGLGSGNYQDALIGAGLGGIGGYINSGGSVPGLGNMPGASLDQVSGIAGMQGPTQGTGLLGSLGGLTQSSGSGISIGGQSMGLGSLLGAAGDIYGYKKGKDDIEDIQRIYQQQSARAAAQINPYAQAGQTALGNLMGDPSQMLQQDPGYQFRLQQGQQAVERSLAAQGLGQSGAALKAAQEYGQGLADQTYQDYFNRQNAIASQGLGASSGLASIYGSQGDNMAYAKAMEANMRNEALSNLFGGGYNSQGNILEGSLSRLLGGLF